MQQTLHELLVIYVTTNSYAPHIACRFVSAHMGSSSLVLFAWVMVAVPDASEPKSFYRSQ